MLQVCVSMKLGDYANDHMAITCHFHLEPKLRTLARDLNEVVNWFSLGVFLGVPTHELERLKLIHSYRKDGLFEMLDLWLKTGDANYRDLISALQSCGLTGLAHKLTTKYGKFSNPCQ